MVNKYTTILPTLSILWLFGSAAASTSTESEQNAEQLEAVLALDGNAEYGAYLVGECLTCHSPVEKNGNIPFIHGKDKRYLASALLEYRNKQRANDVMRDVAASMTNDKIAALVLYLSEQ